MVNLKTILFLQGFPIFKAIEQLASLQDLSETNLNKLNEKRKWDIYRYHLKNNDYYRKLIGDKNIECWEDIPVITKRHLQGNLKSKLSEEFSVEDVYVSNTSGSSGEPFFYAKDKFAHAMTWALNFDRFARHGIYLPRSHQARFYGIPLSGMNHYKERVKDFLMKRYRFSVFDMSNKALENNLRIFRKKKFDHINGYTSAIVRFAKFVIQKGIVLKDICPTLKVCFVTSEICSQSDRDIIEKAFGVRVVNEYGASEMDLVAFEDEDFDWIMSNETQFIEILDENGKSVPHGQQGKIVLTSLCNKAMPLIRYEIGDIGIIRTQQKGKYFILQRLVGRTNDFAVLPSGKVAAGLTFYYITKAVLNMGNKVYELTITQESLSNFKFDYSADKDLSLSDINTILELVEKYLEPGLNCYFERHEILPRTKSGKLKQFRTLVS